MRPPQLFEPPLARSEYEDDAAYARAERKWRYAKTVAFGHAALVQQLAPHAALAHGAAESLACLAYLHLEVRAG